jgi:hypothetical protein
MPPRKFGAKLRDHFFVTDYFAIADDLFLRGHGSVTLARPVKRVAVLKAGCVTPKLFAVRAIVLEGVEEHSRQPVASSASSRREPDRRAQRPTHAPAARSSSLRLEISARSFAASRLRARIVRIRPNRGCVKVDAEAADDVAAWVRTVVAIAPKIVTRRGRRNPCTTPDGPIPNVLDRFHAEVFGMRVF